MTRCNAIMFEPKTDDNKVPCKLCHYPMTDHVVVDDKQTSEVENVDDLYFLCPTGDKQSVRSLVKAYLADDTSARKTGKEGSP